MDAPSNSTETRMMTRSVLAEIPTTLDPLGHLSLTLREGTNRRIDQIPNIVNTYFNFSSTYISQDELVIQQRGPRISPIVFSPDIDTIKQNGEESQTDSGDLNRSSITLRSACKRLQYDSPESPSPETDQINGEESQTVSDGLNKSSITLKNECKSLLYDSPESLSSETDQINGEESQTDSGGLNRSLITLRSECKRLLYDSPESSSSETDLINGEVSQTDLSVLNKSSITLRSARKRLLYDSPEPSSSETPQINGPVAKKLCIEPKCELPEDNCLLLAMKALTSVQLIGIIEQIVDDHPDVEKEIKAYFPKIDLKSHEDRICYLKRNIYKALPSSRLISKRDYTAYNRVSAHLMDFKKYVIDQGRLLAESHQWIAVMDYVFMAWKHVKNTPVWENPCHNAARRQCFKSLAELCMYALKNMKNTLNPNQCENYKKQLKFLSDDHEELLLCLKFLNTEVKFD
ncbi:uncharacterized protein LOC112679926 isoform X3 [Sipha flava]|uniref:Uncharacterized protein LOC112679926 isoform X3 n=1 Tax=Sipha flava TaxID=143950 RepID=A0A8B8F5Q6_9HEMI|nr:uncharacterized protein LOC112679926 isoform X3 [Sipha flava]